MTNKLDFGVQIEPQFGYTFPEIINLVKAAETAKFSSVWLSDHFFLNSEATTQSNLDLWCVLAAISQYTKLNLGTLVASNSYRYPAVHAKLAATVDQLSEGRFEFGIGAGWKEIEYNAYGIPFPSATERISQLAEGIQIIRLLWSKAKTTFEGEHYQLTDAISFPKPYQSSPRIWVGTMGAGPIMLSLIAKYADGINLAWNFSPTACAKTFQGLKASCSEVGRNINKIKRSVGLWTLLVANDKERVQFIRDEAKKQNITEKEVRERYSGALIGTADHILEKIKEYMKIGISHFVFMFLPIGNEAAQFRPFTKQVLSAIK